MKSILNDLAEGAKLSKELAHQVLLDIVANKYSDVQIAAFLSAMRMRPISLEEMLGFRDALLELALPLDIKEFDALDICGSGGDGKNTFNISTLASFVIAACGVKVAKHGSYGSSSLCGSSNLLESIGVRFTTDSHLLKKQLESAGICFLHAPIFHPALKAVAPIRKELGVRTFFNFLGPLVNPSRPSKQVIGVPSPDLAELYTAICKSDKKEYLVVSSLDGYDEVSLTARFGVWSKDGRQEHEPEIFGCSMINPKDLEAGRDVAQASKIFMEILEGRGSNAQNDVVCANAALGISLCKKGASLKDCFAMASAALKGKKALQVYKRLLEN